jgi:tyrosine-protein kinase Etk/Wzc
MAKVDEARESAVIQVLDKAIPPDRRTSPKRTVIVVASFLAAVIVAVLLAFLLEAYQRARLDPASSRRLGELSEFARRWK